VELIKAVAGERVAFGDGEPRVTMTRREALTRILWAMALGGDLAACRVLLEYMEGKPVQRVAAAVGQAELPAVTADQLAQAQAALVTWEVDKAPPCDGTARR
jgi:hypothetical protein